MEDFYPMPMFVKLQVSEMERSMEWYDNVLEFRSVFALPNPEGRIVMCHLRGEKYQDIMLVASDHKGKPETTGIVIQFNTDCLDEIVNRASINNYTILDGPIDRPWNVRELKLRDPDGHTLCFSQSIDPEKTFEEVMRMGT